MGFLQIDNLSKNIMVLFYYCIYTKGLNDPTLHTQHGQSFIIIFFFTGQQKYDLSAAKIIEIRGVMVRHRSWFSTYLGFNFMIWFIVGTVREKVCV